MQEIPKVPFPARHGACSSNWDVDHPWWSISVVSSASGMKCRRKPRTSGDDAGVSEELPKEPKTAEHAGLRSLALRSLLLSRFAVVLLQFLTNNIIPDLTTDAFEFTGVRREDLGTFDLLVERISGGLVRWDSVHFLNIALNGYIFENTLAFFPVLPIFLKKLSSILLNLIPMHESSAVILIGVALSNGCFVVTGMVLFAFVKSIYGSQHRAFWASFLFAWNPAAIFFSSLYTESLYALVTFSGLLVLYGKGDLFARTLVAVVLFTVSFGIRSNGLLNFGYIGYFVIFNIVFAHLRTQEAPFLRICFSLMLKIILILLVVLLIFATIVTRFWNMVAVDFCDGEKSQSLAAAAFAEDNNYVLRGQVEELQWCQAENTFGIFPPYYSHIQKKYWDVEFLGYWKIIKIPCFLLAAPAISMFFFLASRRFLAQQRFNLTSLINIVQAPGGFMPMILTRMLFSATPFLCVELSGIVAAKMSGQQLRLRSVLHWSTWKNTGLSATLLYTYFASYFIGGTVLHASGDLAQ
ncbi:hypothetical protein QR680_009629 [Steinernema hermaphroditum]|uniref:GPI mannosyltransferase 2 n=1 Tax=Steinernema hermaphroditum TaxID=289476 RepID=A0AA39IN27_9BILA|nr:hypothetical protein QR680_009629 [Steinernema hermaphroditum]